MSAATEAGSEHSGIPARILIAGRNLFAGALANALAAHGFATRHVPADADIDLWHGVASEPCDLRYAVARSGCRIWP